MGALRFHIRKPCCTPAAVEQQQEHSNRVIPRQGLHRRLTPDFTLYVFPAEA